MFSGGVESCGVGERSCRGIMRFVGDGERLLVESRGWR